MEHQHLQHQSQLSAWKLVLSFHKMLIPTQKKSDGIEARE
jgi:hypothetical protein